MQNQACFDIKQNSLISTLLCSGEWTITGLPVDGFVLPAISVKRLRVDGTHIQALDTAGALILRDFIAACREKGIAIDYQGLSERHLKLLTLVEKSSINDAQHSLAPRPIWLDRLGKLSWEYFLEWLAMMAFIGEFFHGIFYFILHPREFPFRTFLNTIEQAGYKALGIIALLNFLIGIVLVYQMGLQLKIYGANIYIVNVAGMAILREFAPLITAIIAAGRTSSAYTAHLGMMKINEEIDALLTMGISPMNRLMVPKILGLIVALPLLTVWASGFAIAGSMVMAQVSLDISYYDFIHRFIEVTSLKTYLLGLYKTPVFAWIIASIGCFQATQVQANALSVGKLTTKSVVQAIFMIIIADAFFSIYYSWMNL